MIEDLEIVEKIAYDSLHNIDGSIKYNQVKKFFLRNINGEVVSHSYNGMIFLGNDYYAVGVETLVPDYIFEIDPHTAFGTGVRIAVNWGIILVNRNNKNGEVIPMDETMVVSYLYCYSREEAILKYYDLTGEKLDSENIYKLKKYLF